MSVLDDLLAYEDKLDSPERLAILQAYGVEHYADAAFLNLLKNALIELLEGGSAESLQDNIDISKKFDYSPTETTAQILTKINNLPLYNVSAQQSVWFIGRELVSVPAPGTVQDPSPPALVKYKMLNKGKGNYGFGGIQLLAADIELMYTNAAELGDIEANPDTQTINTGDITGSTISIWLNTHVPPIAIQSQDIGYVLFKGMLDGEPMTYLWLVGAAGTYGAGQLQSVPSNFQYLVDTPIGPYVPPLDTVVQQGNTTRKAISIIAVDDVTGEVYFKTVYGASGTTYTKGEGGQIIVTYQDPIVDSVEYVIPAHATDQVFAMLSDLAAINTALPLKADLVDGKVPAAQLPSYVDDVLEFATSAAFPIPGESGKLYIAINTNITYRWTGTGYGATNSALALGTTAATAFRGDWGLIAYNHSQLITGNPHNTTMADIANLVSTLAGKLSAGANTSLAGTGVRIPRVATDGTISADALMSWIAATRELIIGTIANPGKVNIASNISRIQVQANVLSGQADFVVNSGQEDAYTWKDTAGNRYITLRTTVGDEAVIYRARDVFDQDIFWPSTRIQASLESVTGGARVYGKKSTGETLVFPFTTDTVVMPFELTLIVKNGSASQVIHAKIKTTAKRASSTVSITPPVIEIMSNNATYPGFTAGVELVGNNLQFFFAPAASDPTIYTGAFSEIKYTKN